MQVLVFDKALQVVVRGIAQQAVVREIVLNLLFMALQALLWTNDACPTYGNKYRTKACCVCSRCDILCLTVLEITLRLC